jgi:hypothetical protein
MGDVTAAAAVSLARRRTASRLISPADNIASSNNLLVSAPLLGQFFWRHRKGYDRDHRDHL